MSILSNIKAQLLKWSRLYGILFPLTLGGVGGGCLLSSCSNMLETDSELVEYEKDNTLNHPTDSVYSVMGIVHKMQQIADRVVLLGEVRADLMSVTEAASADLKRLAAFDMTKANKYNQVSDYYAVINNCNYFLAHVDTAMQRRGRQLFINEYAAVKGFRAWAYLELVKAYGEVPLVTTPMMTEREAAAAVTGPRSGIQTICDYFIEDLTPIAYVEMPSYGEIGGYQSSEFFIPTRVLLGDLCLWAGRYDEAAKWYSDFLNDKKSPVLITNGNRSRWPSPTSFTIPSKGYYLSSSEELTMIPMERQIYHGTVSDLPNIFNSTTENYQYYQLKPSMGMRQISSSQIYAMEYRTDVGIDTILAPRDGFSDAMYVGDLRLCSNYSILSLGGQSEYSEYNAEYQTISKVERTGVLIYRSPMVYLRFAEALNRAGYPQSAMLILKYGLCNENAREYMDSVEYKAAGKYINFDENYFKREYVSGIHSRGSGDSEVNPYYVLPQPPTALASRQDTVNYQIPLVEDMIITEMALEGAFEGYRFYDLMRVALRRSDPAYLADAVSRREGTTDASLRALLMDTKNWYLPLP